MPDPEHEHWCERLSWSSTYVNDREVINYEHRTAEQKYIKAVWTAFHNRSIRTAVAKENP